MKRLFRQDLICPDLSYQIVGILFSVHTDLGHQLLEKHYQRAIESAFVSAKIPFQAQAPVPLEFKDKIIGNLFADFIVDNKIIIEIKAKPRLNLIDFQQASMYLNAFDKQLTILANFRPAQLIFRRIVRENTPLAKIGNSS